MTDEYITKIAKQAQDYYKDTPVIILGSGASAAFNMSGMGNLSKHLISSISIENISEQDKNSWLCFCDLLEKNIDLESALHRVTLSQELTDKIVVSTWNLLTHEDLIVFGKSLNNKELFSLGKLLKHMFRSTIKNINIITPNYDRLAEYACEQENIHHYSGFSHGYRRNIVDKNYLSCGRKVNIWKVHGSLDWFVNGNGVISALGNVDKIPNGLKPLIVTPGIEKYRSTHKEPYKTTIHESDNVIDLAMSYLCIGFGFNDEHIQEKLINRCAKDEAKIIIITHKLTESAKKFIFDGNVTNYLAIESDDNHNLSKIYSSLCTNEIIVDRNYWSLDGFLELIL